MGYDDWDNFDSDDDWDATDWFNEYYDSPETRDGNAEYWEDGLIHSLDDAEIEFLTQEDSPCLMQTDANAGMLILTCGNYSKINNHRSVLFFNGFRCVGQDIFEVMVYGVTKMIYQYYFDIEDKLPKILWN